MICYNEHDKHLTKINLNKFALWICPLFKENSDLSWKFKKKKRKKKKKEKRLGLEKNQIYICVKGKKQDFYQEISVMFCVKLKKFWFVKKKNQICFK